MRALGVEGVETTVALRVWFILTLIVWTISALLLAMSPGGSAGEVPVTFIAYWVAAAFVVSVLARAVARTGGLTRVFWTIVGAALLFRFTANIGPTGLFGPPLLADLAYGASYGLFYAAILLLVVRVARSITLLAALDTLSVMLFTGLISWHFAFSPMISDMDWGTSFKSLLLARSGPVFDVGLLCLALVVAHSNRSLAPRAFSLAGAFGAFLVADGLCLGLRLDEVGGCPELFWGLGISFIGLAALSADGSPIPIANSVTKLVVRPRAVAVFWFSPLSPAVQLAFLLAWGALRPPLPSYMLWGGAILTLYLALRISLATYASRRLRGEAEQLAKVSERDLISKDLHDALKQSVHSIPMMLAAYQKIHEKDPDKAKIILERAVRTSEEASYQVSGPIRELQLGGRTSTLDVRSLLGQLVQDIRCSFSIEVEQDLQAPFEELSSERLTAAYRIMSEALWNAARHSGAAKIKVETREIGRVFLVRVRDDGHGFDTEQQASGMGISLMRRRAEEARGELDVISNPDRGTTIQIRFNDG